jgi:hypothetical protein
MYFSYASKIVFQKYLNLLQNSWIKHKHLLEFPVLISPLTICWFSYRTSVNKATKTELAMFGQKYSLFIPIIGINKK